jgi:glycosyltransferase involved in cell wall biosynthesis
MIMRELVRIGHDCTIITSDSNALSEAPKFLGRVKHENIDGVKVYWLKTSKYKKANSFQRVVSWLDFEWQLWRLPKKQIKRPDAVIVSSLSLLTIMNGLLLRIRYRCRLIFEIRDIWPLTLTEEGGYSRLNPFVFCLGLLEKIGYRYADEIVGTMPNLGKHVAKILGFSRDVHCIPMGFDHRKMDEVIHIRKDKRPLDFLPAGRFIVGYVGSMGITNALDTFFGCAASMKNYPNIHFLAVGDGDSRHKYAERFGRLPNLTIAPSVAKPVVSQMLAVCDLLYFSVFPSRVWNYGQSLNKLIEYMLAGKPVLASYSGFPSMINEANCGSFLPAGDKTALQNEIIRFSNMEQSEREEIGMRGRAWVLQNRSYEKLAHQYLGILN